MSQRQGLNSLWYKLDQSKRNLRYLTKQELNQGVKKLCVPKRQGRQHDEQTNRRV